MKITFENKATHWASSYCANHDSAEM